MNNTKSIDRQLLDWAFAELRKEFRIQANRFDALAAVAVDTDDTQGIEQFTAAATAWKRALDRVIDIDVRVMIKRDVIEDEQDNESNLGNKE